MSNGSITWFWIRLRFARGGDAVAEQGSKRGGHKEEHGAGEEEAVGDPLVVEKTCCLRVKRAEETFDAAYGAVRVEDARVAGLPGDETNEEGEGNRQPCPEDRWRQSVGLWLWPRGRGREERSEEIAESLAEFAERNEAEEKSCRGEDGKEVAQDEGELVEMGPMHLVRQSPDRSGEDPGEADRGGDDEEVEKQRFYAPIDSFQHDPGVAQTHHRWCRIVDEMNDGGLILRVWRGPTDLERQRVR